MGPKVKATVSGKAAAVKNPEEKKEEAKEKKEEVKEKRSRKLSEEEMAEQEEMSEHEEEEESANEDKEEESDIEGDTEEELGDEDEEETTAEEGESEPASKEPKKAKVVGKAAGKGAAASNATFVVSPVSSYDILVAAISSNEDKKGISINGIKKYLKDNHPDKDWDRVKLHVRKALLRGLENGTFIRPKNSENATGLTGRFKMNKEKSAPKKNGTTSSSDKAKKVTKAPVESSKGTSKAAVAKPKKVPAKVSDKKTEKKPEKENKVAAKKVKEAPQPKGKAKETTTKAEPKKVGRQPPKSRA